jgi:hypothetical protein
MEDTTTDATERSDVRHNVYYGNDGVTYLFTSLGTEHVDWPRHRREEMRKKEMREENNKRWEEDKKVNEKRWEEDNNVKAKRKQVDNIVKEKRTEMDKNVKEKRTEMDKKVKRKENNDLKQDKKEDKVKEVKYNLSRNENIKRWAKKRKENRKDDKEKRKEYSNKLKEELKEYIKKRNINEKEDKKEKGKEKCQEEVKRASEVEQIDYKNGLLSILKDCKGWTLKEKVDIVIEYTEKQDNY